ncbi:Protease synthase and sporulation negative regulatory protein PAI 1 [bacterium YEK0313]|nr:Protease synthase and sporulation negative regulatory protein PAI 1 [bacterium YEK0313]
MLIEVRAADLGDLALLVALNQPAQSLHAGLCPEDFKAEPDPEEIRAFFRAQLGEPGSLMAIAWIDAVAAGYVWLDVAVQLETAFLRERSYLVVQQLAVAPGLRRRGVGRALIGYAEQVARDRGLGWIDLGTWAANAEARAFFAAVGFATTSLVLRRLVGGG